MSACWIIRAKEPVEGFDFNALPVTLTAGQRGLMPQAEAIQAARAGTVEMLSPDGMAAMLDASQDLPELVPAASAPTPEIPETTDGLQAEAQTPAPSSVAPVAPRRGPQMKRPG